MKTLLICHDEVPLHREGLARWLASWSDLVGIVSLAEHRHRRWKRIRREARRVGVARLADVLAFRAYYGLRLRARDAAWMGAALEQLRDRFPPVPPATPILRAPSPNTADAERFIRGRAPDVVLALCKQIIKASVFTIPPHGTFVLHPGICPEYRNAHGCFWALANGDVERVGMTLLRIDRGVDTGPVFGYFSYPYDERTESHVVIQHRVVLENLDRVEAQLQRIVAGEAAPIPTTGRTSAEWGQPWLTRYLGWQRRIRRSNNARLRS